MGVCSTAVVAAATLSAANRRRRYSLVRHPEDHPITSSSSIVPAGSDPLSRPQFPSAEESQESEQDDRNFGAPSPPKQPCRLSCHRWRRASRLSAAAQNHHLDPHLCHPRPEATSCGRELIPRPSSPSHPLNQDFSHIEVSVVLPDSETSSSSLVQHHSSCICESEGAMFSPASTNSVAEYGVTSSGSHIESPLFPHGAKETSVREERLKRRLRFFFLNPVQKWAATRRFPFKLSTQIIKIIFVTVQLCLFASFRDSHVFYARNTEVAFSHIFLEEWDATREAPPYPPSAGPLAVYSKEQFHQYLDFAINNYANLETSSMGAYFHAKNSKGSKMTYCQTDYSESRFDSENDAFSFNSRTTEECVEIPLDPDFKSESFFQENNITISALTLVEASLLFSIKGIHFKPNGPLNSPDCYAFDLRLVFDNQGEDGQLLVSLVTEARHLDCKGTVDPPVSDGPSKSIRSAVNILVIGTCALSLYLCGRAVLKAQLLKWETNEYFQRQFNRRLSKHDRLEFLNLWYVLIIVNDVLLIGGSIIKELMEKQHVENDMWDVCSVLLGTGNLFVWFGVLRYLGFFRTYNMLIVTLKKAFPSVLRFLLCALLIYCGFTFCGWLIFGPYHFKFQTISSTSECLFSLVNGDDMFATFAGMSERSQLVWWFSRLYLYSFISLFIYVVLSLFIALIMDTYETIKMYYTEGFPKSDLRQFIANDDCVDGSIPVYESQNCLPQIWSRLFRRRRHSGYETIPDEDDSLGSRPQHEQPILA